MSEVDFNAVQGLKNMMSLYNETPTIFTEIFNN